MQVSTGTTKMILVSITWPIMDHNQLKLKWRIEEIVKVEARLKRSLKPQTREAPLDLFLENVVARLTRGRLWCQYQKALIKTLTHQVLLQEMLAKSLEPKIWSGRDRCWVIDQLNKVLKVLIQVPRTSEEFQLMEKPKNKNKCPIQD